MKRFAELYHLLDSSTSTNRKTEALANYLRNADSADAAWAVFFLTGNRPRQAVPVKRMRAWAAELAGIAEWLFDESYDAVGDLAETIALILPPAQASHARSLADWVENTLLPLRDKDEDAQKAALVRAWQDLSERERFVWNKLITGSFRVGVSHKLVVKALELASGVDAKVIAHRLMGDWRPSAAAFGALTAARVEDADQSRPYPFFLAYALESAPEALGPIEDWQLEWKWDGIRAQLVRRAGQIYLWSRGEELVTQQFPEVAQAAAALPDCVIDGEILAWREGRVAPFALLQTRIGRKSPGKKSVADAPVALLAYDLLEQDGADLRAEPLAERREKLEALRDWAGAKSTLVLSPLVHAASWDEVSRLRAESRTRGVEGLMLKARASGYGVGRVRGSWWKWKIEPYTVDAVLIYAQRGHGRRASLYTDYTFGVWDNSALVPFAKAYSGLTDEEIARVDAFIRRNTIEQFGPVRTVKPALVFELAFEGIQRSSRHRSGVAVRFPRINRWRQDKTIEQADTLATVSALIAASSSS